MLGRVFRVRGWCAALLIALGFDLAPSRASAEEEAVRVAYAAPASCPDEQVFVARVRARTEHGRFAEPSELARTFDVSLTASPRDAGFAGQIEFIDVDGARARRNVTGATCDEVTSSLALIMALSIDDRVALAEARDNQSAPLPPTAAPSEPPKKVTQSSAAGPSASPSPAPPALRLRWDVGVNAGALAWLAPNVALAFGAFAELGSREHSWSARLSAFDARQTNDVNSGQQAHSATDWLRAEFCPIALPAGVHVSVSPCAAVDAGIVTVTARGGAVIPRGPKTTFWASGVALVRLGWEFKGRVIVNLDGELGVPLTREDFRIQNPDGSTTTRAFRAPALGVGAKAGVGVRFP